MSDKHDSQLEAAHKNAMLNVLRKGCEPKRTTPITDDMVERAGIAVMEVETCGYTVSGKRTFCDDEILGDKKDPYGNNLKQAECDCRKAGRAALNAALESE